MPPAPDHPPPRPASDDADHGEAIDLEVLDEDSHGVSDPGAPGAALRDFAAQMQMAPEMLVAAFRAMIVQRLKRWFVRSLIWGGVLGLLATEHAWARVVFWIWAVIAFLQLAFLSYAWYASGRQGAKLGQLFGGMMTPPGPPA